MIFSKEFNPQWLTWGALGILALWQLYPPVKAQVTKQVSKPSQSVQYHSNNAYIARLLPAARRLETSRGIPASITIAIAVHETGWGRAVIGMNNHWGLKCVDRTGRHCTKTRTNEWINGRKGSYRLAFESCKDLERCTNILANTLDNLLARGGGSKTLYQQNPDRALDLIGKRYATDLQWSNKVKRHRQKVLELLTSSRR